MHVKNPWTSGDLFHPHILLTLSWTDGPQNYYVYDVPTVVSGA